MGVCLFQFVTKRFPSVYGLPAMLFPFITNAYYYAYEARPYGILLGFGALSLLCWQRAAVETGKRRFWICALGASNALSVFNHYYGILLIVPLMIGELIRSMRSRKVDLPVWAALGCFFLPIIVCLPLIMAARTYSAHFWGKPGISSLVLFYDYLLRPALLPIVAILILSVIRSYKGKNIPFRSGIHHDNLYFRSMNSAPFWDSL